MLVAILWSPFALLLSLPSLVISVATSPVLLLSLVLFVLVITVVSAALAFDAVRGRIEKANDAGEEAEAHRRSSLGEVGSEHGSTDRPCTDQRTMRARGGREHDAGSMEVTEDGSKCVESMSIRELKAILTKTHVAFDTFMEKAEFVEAVRKLEGDQQLRPYGTRTHTRPADTCGDGKACTTMRTYAVTMGIVMVWSESNDTSS